MLTEIRILLGLITLLTTAPLLGLLTSSSALFAYGLGTVNALVLIGVMVLFDKAHNTKQRARFHNTRWKTNNQP